MKTVYIGDIHGLTSWEKIVRDNPNADNYVFVGDYFDSFDISGIEQLFNVENIVRFKKILTSNEFFKKNLNKIICSDSIIGLNKIEDNSIDMVITSPPYDQLRDYEKKAFDLDGTGEEIFRVLKNGSICAVVLQDQTKNFGKSLTTFKTAVNWCDKIGFKLFETVIYRKHGSEGAWWTKRFRVDHEYIHLFLKGERPNYFNKTPLKIPSKHGGKTMIGSGNRKTDGSTTKTTTLLINKMKCRGTVWDYLNAGDKDNLKRMHPAPFPDKIPYDLIN